MEGHGDEGAGKVGRQQDRGNSSGREGRQQNVAGEVPGTHEAPHP